MDNKKMKIVWAVSLLVIGILAIINGIARITSFKLPGAVVIVMTVLNIIALVSLIFSAFKIKDDKSDEQEK